MLTIKCPFPWWASWLGHPKEDEGQHQRQQAVVAGVNLHLISPVEFDARPGISILQEVQGALGIGVVVVGGLDGRGRHPSTAIVAIINT